MLTDANCKNCRAPLGDDTSLATGSTPQGIVLEDGYVLPPPPQPNPLLAGVWRNKSTLVMSKNARLPNRCVKCNEPADVPPLKRRLTWHHPAFYLIIFVALLIYVIVALVVRQTANVEVGLCEKHKAKRKRDILITWSLVLLGVVGFALAIVASDGNYALLGLLLLLVGTVYGIVTTRIVNATRIDKDFVFLSGVNKDYLDQLPQWPGA